MPGLYAKSFGRAGSLALMEKEYNVVTAVTIDMSKWDHFVHKFTSLVRALGTAGFRSFLKKNPQWPDAVADREDSIYDVVEFLKRVPSVAPSSDVKKRAKHALDLIGYPSAIDAASQETIQIRNATEIRISIQADELLENDKPTDDPSEHALTIEQKIIKKWNEANQDLRLPKNLKLKVTEFNGERTLQVSAKFKTPQSFEARVWLPATRKVELTIFEGVQGTTQTLHRDGDYFEALNFPEDSFMVAEAHSQGVPTIHGLGMTFKPLMGRDEERGIDPFTGAAGPDYYRMTEWNKATGWGSLVLLK
jgi:hypothetical protein